MIAQRQRNNEENLVKYRGKFTRNSFLGILPPEGTPMSSTN
uniref:Uncharacterized protein n=1 Tax=Arundo donax TaxID=35708 RepID=A0A0A8YUC4_ARUDO